MFGKRGFVGVKQNAHQHGCQTSVFLKKIHDFTEKKTLAVPSNAQKVGQTADGQIDHQQEVQHHPAWQDEREEEAAGKEAEGEDAGPRVLPRCEGQEAVEDPPVQPRGADHDPEWQGCGGGGRLWRSGGVWCYVDCVCLWSNVPSARPSWGPTPCPPIAPPCSACVCTHENDN